MRTSFSVLAAISSANLTTALTTSPLIIPLAGRADTDSTCTDLDPPCVYSDSETTYLPRSCFPSTGVCYPTTYYAAQDEGQMYIGDGSYDEQMTAKCQAACDGNPQCAAFVGTENITPDGTLATGTCFFYSTQKILPRPCADSPSRIVAYYKAEVCSSSSGSSSTTSSSTMASSTTSLTTISSTFSSTTTSSATTSAIAPSGTSCTQIGQFHTYQSQTPDSRWFQVFCSFKSQAPNIISTSNTSSFSTCLDTCTLAISCHSAIYDQNVCVLYSGLTRLLNRDSSYDSGVVFR